MALPPRLPAHPGQACLPPDPPLGVNPRGRAAHICRDCPESQNRNSRERTFIGLQVRTAGKPTASLPCPQLSRPRRLQEPRTPLGGWAALLSPTSRAPPATSPAARSVSTYCAQFRRPGPPAAQPAGFNSGRGCLHFRLELTGSSCMAPGAPSASSSRLCSALTRWAGSCWGGNGSPAFQALLG